MQNKFMIILVVLGCWISIARAESSIPPCWSELTTDVGDGEFIINVDAGLLTKEQILEVLDLASGRYVMASGFPLVSIDHLAILVKAYDSGYGKYKLSREELMAAVSAELEVIAQYPGVTVQCNGQVSLP